VKAIITDYDYTLSDKFLTVELFLFLEEKKMTPLGYKKEFNELRQEYHDGKKEYNEFVAADMDLIKKYIKNLKYTDLLRTLREDFDIEGNLFDWSKKIREFFKQDEWMFIIVSSSFGVAIEQMQDVLDFDTYLASSYEVKSGFFTGEFSCHVTSKEKRNYVKMLKDSFEKIIVVGDAPGDFGMMEFANSAFLFEPDEKTRNEIGDIKHRVVNRDNILEFLKKEI
jgi:phosphoserine phosphatase